MPGEQDKLTREQVLARWAALKTERASWIPHWKEISTYLLPRSGRFFTRDRNRGDRRHNNIYDNTGVRALRVLAAGMMSGMTSPARPWFRLTTADENLADYAPVKAWLADVCTLMHRIFQRSNTYRALHSGYEELGAFGTSSNIIVADFDTVIHNYPLTAGEYAIATNWKGQVTTLYREFEKTVGEVVAEFGLDKVSLAVKNAYDRGALDQWVPIIHAIEPRKDRDPNAADSKNMPWRSVYIEPSGRSGDVLRESGFNRFPALCPRWSVSGGDQYGNSPGMEALGDVKQLQLEQLRKAQAIDYQTNPPLQAPTSMANREVSTLPGGVTYVDMVGPNAGLRTAFDVRIDLSHLLLDIQDARHRVDGAFYADLFLLLANQTDVRMTATEVAERHEEKMLMLGPVLERLQDELLAPLIEVTFQHILAAGILPPPPQELQGHDINLVLLGILAQAQRAIATNSVDRFVGNLGAVAQFKPDVLDKFDSDKWADIYADALGLDPRIIVPDDKVQVIRAQRQNAQAAAQQAALMNQGADTAHKLASANTGGQNALTDITRAFSGYTT